MLRRTLTILSLLGLLLSVGLWGLSYFNIFLSNGRYSMRLERGSVRCDWPGPFVVLGKGRAAYPPGYWSVEVRAGKTFAGVNLGVHVDGFRNFRTYGMPWIETRLLMHSWGVPMWMATGLFGSMLWLFYHPQRRRRRKKLGLCIKCGYDLRGSKNRCPECGTGFSK